MGNPTTASAESPQVAGIILAAGESSRMGRDKALLPLGRQTFLEHLVEVLAGEVSPVLIVLGHHAAEIEGRIPPRLPVQILRNPDYRLGQLNSLQVALRFLQNRAVAGALICLVDHPAVSKGGVRALLERFQQTGAPVVIPTFRGRRGHPVLFARRLFEELLRASLEEGARSVVRRHEGELECMETGEEGVVLDVDLPADYEAVKTRWETLTGTGEEPPGEPS